MKNRFSFAIGLVFGFSIAGARLSDYDVIHRMLLLQELDVFLLMGSAIFVAAPILYLLRRKRWQTPTAGELALVRSSVERKHVAGSVVFGTGWAVAGTCPGPALAMTAGGTVLGIVVMAGLVVGIALRDVVTRLPVSRAEPSERPAPDRQAAATGA